MNWLLMAGVLLLVSTSRSSGALASLRQGGWPPIAVALALAYDVAL